MTSRHGYDTLRKLLLSIGNHKVGRKGPLSVGEQDVPKREPPIFFGPGTVCAVFDLLHLNFCDSGDLDITLHASTPGQVLIKIVAPLGVVVFPDDIFAYWAV